MENEKIKEEVKEEEKESYRRRSIDERIADLKKAIADHNEKHEEYLKKKNEALQKLIQKRDNPEYKATRKLRVIRVTDAMRKQAEEAGLSPEEFQEKFAKIIEEKKNEQ